MQHEVPRLWTARPSGDRAARGRQRRVPPPQARLPVAHGRAHARAARRRRGRLADSPDLDPRALPHRDRGRSAAASAVTRSRPFADWTSVAKQLLVAVEPRGERVALDGAPPRGGRVPLAIGQHLAHRVGERLGSRRLVALPGDGCGTPMPASSPTSSTVPPLAGWTTGTPQAIASITVLGHGSFTFVCRRSVRGGSGRARRAARSGRSARRGRAARAARAAARRERRACRRRAAGRRRTPAASAASVSSASSSR